MAKIIGITLAVTKMKEMIDFYQKIFALEFEEQEMHGFKLYKANLDAIEILFCPAELAQNTATQNRHQLNINVADLESTIIEVSQYGGEVMGESQKVGSFIQVGIKDPDGNSLVLKERVA